MWRSSQKRFWLWTVQYSPLSESVFDWEGPAEVFLLPWLEGASAERFFGSAEGCCKRKNHIIMLSTGKLSTRGFPYRGVRKFSCSLHTVCFQLPAPALLYTKHLTLLSSVSLMSLWAVTFSVLDLGAAATGVEVLCCLHVRKEVKKNSDYSSEVVDMSFAFRNSTILFWPHSYCSLSILWSWFDFFIVLSEICFTLGLHTQKHTYKRINNLLVY